jgi:hypothetical protein
MSTVNAAIPLASQVPQQPSMVDQLQKLQMLKNMQQEGQLNTQSLQTNDMKLQQMRQDTDDAAAARQIMGKYKDPKDAIPELQQKLGQKAVPLAESIMKQEQAIASLDETQRKTALEKMNTFSGAVDDVFSLPPDQRPAAWENKKNLLAQSGHLNPDQVTQLPQWDDQLMLGKGNELKRQISDLEIKSKKAGAEKAESDAKIAAQTAAGTTPTTPYQQATLNKPDYGKSVPLPPAVEAQQVRMDAAKEKAKQQGAGGIAPQIQGGTYTGEPGKYDENILKGLPPGEANIIKGMVEGRVSMPTGMSASKEPWVSRLRIANAYDPSFDQSQWQTRVATRVDFAKGKAALQIRSLNTLIKHLDQLWDASEKLDNTGLTGSTKLGNYIVNAGKEQFGSAAVKDWDTTATAAGSEMAALLKGASPTDQEVNEQKKVFNKNDPKSTQQEAIRSTLHLAFGRLDAVKRQYEEAFKKQKDFRFLTPQSEKIAKNKLGVDPNELEGPGVQSAPSVTAPQGNTNISVTAPDGSVYQFPNQASANKFKQLAGIK